jgi:hypothetical protein
MYMGMYVGRSWLRQMDFFWLSKLPESAVPHMYVVAWSSESDCNIVFYAGMR